ncbi:hypothetical protein [Ottowia thiooxydans]|uniref:Uncharacterized protein n=1 Tax=Ottowia thiooxydans TaxID=219182 RepID=A0ABV2Q5U5_9BURK
MNNPINSQSFKPISIGGRDLSVSKTAVERGSDREHIGSVVSRIFDSIVDWFSGTNHAEAKRCLFDLYSPDTSVAQKYQAFSKLELLTGESYKGNFAVEEGYLDGTLMCSLNIDLGNGLVERFQVDKNELCFKDLNPTIEVEHLQRIFEEVASATISPQQTHQFGADLARTGVTIVANGDEVGVFRSGAELSAELEKQGYDSDQIELISKFCVQTTEGIVCSEGVSDYKVGVTQGQGTAATQVYTVERSSDGLQIRLSASFNAGAVRSVEDLSDMAQTAKEADQIASQTHRKDMKTFIKGSTETTLFFPVGETRPSVTVAMTMSEYVGPGAAMPAPTQGGLPPAFGIDPRMFG